MLQKKNHFVQYKFSTWIMLGGHRVLNIHFSFNENAFEKPKKFFCRWDFIFFPRLVEGWESTNSALKTE